MKNKTTAEQLEALQSCAKALGLRIETKSRGQADYEADVAKRPTYHDGSPRRTWDELSKVAKWSWEYLP